MTRAEKAEELFKKGCNCAQAVFGALCEDVGMDMDTALKVSEPMGAGTGRMRLTCGAVSGMAMAAGMKLSSGTESTDTRGIVYDTVHSMADEFKVKYGTVICADLLGIGEDKKYCPTPEVRTKEYYEKRPCLECVKDCVAIAEKYLKLN